ncbi:MAG: hypothetical protein KKE30_03815 [Gammaproteobacteria bacterium]|nr:hypothetical protein [Gammaproteobacteria bacterium]MBU1555337.1 hypothetical protein [Gammaproteobacteria bacterium]MBU2071875.1 hypothetical protein [Gammaproteobacteria bacterium]MBU2181736.1 hypothetical protein [Gammaproteobacteria bacterium]MBU2206324.1 hypothetical protein [Gammaproteobacteria bacterium]
MNSLPETIDSFFTSLVPSLWQLAILVYILYFLVKKSYILKTFLIVKKSILSVESIADNRIVKETGILKLVPILVLIALVVLAMAVQRTASTIGSWIPGQLGWSQPSVLVHAVSAERLGSIWASYKGIENVHMLWSLIELRALEAEKQHSEENPPYWKLHERRYSKYGGRVYFSKFAILFTLLLYMVAKRKRILHPNATKRSLLIILVFFVYIGFCFSNQIEAKKQSDIAKSIYVDLELQLKRETILKYEDYEQYIEKITIYQFRDSKEEILQGFWISN